MIERSFESSIETPTETATERTMCDGRVTDYDDEWIGPILAAIERHRKDSGQYVYFARALGDGVIKIGVSKDLHYRCKMLKYSDKVEMLPLVAVHGDPWLERAIHGWLRQHLARGREWYNPSDEINYLVESVQKLTVLRYLEDRRLGRPLDRWEGIKSWCPWVFDPASRVRQRINESLADFFTARYADQPEMARLSIHALTAVPR